jgi:cysteine desulfurase
VELARKSVAELIGARPKSITFTSGGTESIHLAIRGALAATGRRTIVTTPIEHAAIRDLAETLRSRDSVEIRMVPLDSSGLVRTASLASLIDESVGVVSIQWANNETGIIQPVGEIAEICTERRVLFHCDATQWVGKMPTRMNPERSPSAPLENPSLQRGGLPDIPLLTFAPHKFHGPKGIGVVYAAPGVRLVPQTPGAQEKGRRAGTENVPGIVGAGVAASLASRWLADPDERSRLGALRDRFEQGVLAGYPDARINGAGAPRLWNTSSIAFPRLEAEALLLLMSEAGLCASAGAACSSGSLEPSPVLLAMGIPPELAHGSVRFSLSRETTADEIERAVPLVVSAAEKLRGS